MSPSAHTPDDLRGLHWALGLLLLLAPLFRAGNRPLPLLAIELICVGLLVFYLAKPYTSVNLPKGVQLALAILVVLPLLQLLPLPPTLAMVLPGHGSYHEALRLVGHNPGWRPLSVIPHATEQAWLVLLPPLTMFLLASRLHSASLRWLSLVVIGMASAQALLGLMQVGGGADSPLRLGNLAMGDSAVGTYVNRNHLAGLLIMALPMVLGLLSACLNGHSEPNKPRSIRQHLATLGSSRQQRLFVYSVVSLVIIVGLVFTRSRAGIGLGMLGILLSAAVFARRLGSSRIIGLLGTVTLLGGILMVQIGLAPVLERFASDDPLQDERWMINTATLHTIGEFFPLGSGVGTYPDVFRRFQPDTVTGFINRAHNDYLEWISGGGLIMVVVVGLFSWEYLRRWPSILSQQSWSRLHFLQVGAGIGLLLLGLHSLVDFNLHIPANAIYFAFLAALFWHPHHAPIKRRRRRRHSTVPTPVPVEPPQEPVPNPFAD